MVMNSNSQAKAARAFAASVLPLAHGAATDSLSLSAHFSSRLRLRGDALTIGRVSPHAIEQTQSQRAITQTIN